MEVGGWREAFALVGAAVASAFALLRLLLGQHRALVERFINVLEAYLKRQEAAHDRTTEAVQALTEGVRDQGRILRRLEEALAISVGERRHP